MERDFLLILTEWQKTVNMSMVNCSRNEHLEALRWLDLFQQFKLKKVLQPNVYQVDIALIYINFACKNKSISLRKSYSTFSLNQCKLWNSYILEMSIMEPWMHRVYKFLEIYQWNLEISLLPQKCWNLLSMKVLQINTSLKEWILVIAPHWLSHATKSIKR